MHLKMQSLNMWVAATFAAALFVFANPQALAQPAVSWQPDRIDIEIEEKTEIVKTVQYRSGRALPNGTFFVTPSLYPVLALGSTSPTRTANQTVNLDLFFVAPTNAKPGDTFAGTIHIRNGNATVARPLPVRVTVVSKRALGQDADQNGIWDDVDAAISQLYPNSPQIASIQIIGAKAMQQKLVAGSLEDEVALSDAAQQSRKWASCLVQLENFQNLEPGFANKQVAFMRGLFLTSDDRVAAYRRSEELLAGTIGPAANVTLAECVAQ